MFKQQMILMISICLFLSGCASQPASLDSAPNTESTISEEAQQDPESPVEVDMVESLNEDLSGIMDAGSNLFTLLAGVTALPEAQQTEKFAEANKYSSQISAFCDTLLEKCEQMPNCDYIAYQTNLLKNSAPSNLLGKSVEDTIGNAGALYQLFLQQLSSSFSYYAEEMLYVSGESQKKNEVSYFKEVPDMPTPDSCIYAISYESRESNSGVTQYRYLIGDNESDANLNYNLYLSAINMVPELQVEYADSYTYVTKNGQMISAMMAGTDPDLGYFLVVSFKE